MDSKQFTADRTGELEPFQNAELGREDWRFSPAPLPPNWRFPERLWPLLCEAHSALGTLNGIGQTLPHPLLLLRPLQARESLASTRIEGTFVAPRQLLLYELSRGEPRTPEQADQMEAANYSEALRLGCDLLQEIPLSGRLIRSMHQTLMAGVRGSAKQPGAYRKLQVQIGANAKYVPPAWEQVEPLMRNLEEFMNLEQELDPLVAAFIAHYQFEAIHPFLDGNGRVGRALLALMIYHKLAHAMPWLYMSAYFSRYKDEYVDGLFRVSARGDWEAWIEFCLRAFAQAKDAAWRCARFNAVRQRYYDAVAKFGPSSRSHDLIDSLFEAPATTIPEVQKQFGVSYKTARGDVFKLVEAGVLQEFQPSHPKTYFAMELLRVAFLDEGEDDAELDDPGKPAPQGA